MVNFQVAHGVHHNLLDEGLDPIVVVQRNSQDVGPDVLVHGGILVQELLDSLTVDQHHLAARLVPVGDLVVLEETGEVLWISPVSTGEGEENMEHPQIF